MLNHLLKPFVKTIWPWKSDVDTVFSQAYGIYKIGAKEEIQLQYVTITYLWRHINVIILNSIKSTVQVEAATGRAVKVGTGVNGWF